MTSEEVKFKLALNKIENKDMRSALIFLHDEILRTRTMQLHFNLADLDRKFESLSTRLENIESALEQHKKTEKKSKVFLIKLAKQMVQISRSNLESFAEFLSSKNKRGRLRLKAFIYAHSKAEQALSEELQEIYDDIEKISEEGADLDLSELQKRVDFLRGDQKRDEGKNRIPPNSLLFWFPKIKDLGIPVPKTEVVKIPHRTLMEFLYREESKLDVLAPFIHKIKEKARKIGYPLFLRTDQASGKHDWEDTCYVEDEEGLLGHIHRVLEFGELAQIPGLPSEALVFREFIELEWKFKAFRGMPVARERRYFIRDGGVLCHHPYWIEEAIRFWGDTTEPPNWRELLKDLNAETEEEIKLLTSYARRVASVLDGYWSIDFAHAKDGRWILIDMAWERSLGTHRAKPP